MGGNANDDGDDAVDGSMKVNRRVLSGGFWRDI